MHRFAPPFGSRRRALDREAGSGEDLVVFADTDPASPCADDFDKSSHARDVRRLGELGPCGHLEARPVVTDADLNAWKTEVDLSSHLSDLPRSEFGIRGRNRLEIDRTSFQLRIELDELSGKSLVAKLLRAVN